VAEIREIHTESGEAYGVLRVHADLHGFEHHVNRKRVARLMREHVPGGRHLHRRQRTTVPDPVAPPAPDLMQRDFTAFRLDERWCGDITLASAPYGDNHAPLLCRHFRSHRKVLLDLTEILEMVAISADDEV
jgi:transposase InsO family protein